MTKAEEYQKALEEETQTWPRAHLMQVIINEADSWEVENEYEFGSPVTKVTFSDGSILDLRKKDEQS